MRAFDYEIVQQKIRNVLDGLSKEEQKVVLSHLLHNDEMCKGLDPDERARMVAELASIGAAVAAKSTADATVTEAHLPSKGYLSSNAAALMVNTNQLRGLRKSREELDARIAKLKEEYNTKLGEMDLVIDTLHNEGWHNDDISTALAEAGLVGAVHALGSKGAGEQTGLTTRAAIPFSKVDFLHATSEVREAQFRATPHDELMRQAELNGIIEPKPDPDDPSISPGESFLARSEEEDLAPVMRSLKRDLEAGAYGKTPARIWLKNRVFDEIVALGLKYGATPAQVQYVCTVWMPNMDAREPPYGVDNVRLNRAWAAAEEFIPNVRELMAEFERRIGKATWPPSAGTPTNLEALCMALGYCWGCFSIPGSTEEERARIRDLEARGQLLSNLIAELSKRSDRLDLFVRKTKLVYDIPQLSTFALGWCDSNFAKLEVSHKLAASLALTEIPDDVEVQAPWMAWSFIIPPGLFDDILDDGRNGVMKDPPEKVSWSRAFCFGTDITYIVYSNGTVIGPLDRASMASDDTDNIGKMLDNMVRGACLALSDPEQYKKKRIGSSSSSGNKREGGAPDLSCARYMLTAPVQVDLRDVLKAVQRGEKHGGGKLTVQFLVRGHWKNQAYGPKHSLRKRMWIQPFWKGPEESRVLLRNYVVKDDEKGTDDQKAS